MSIIQNKDGINRNISKIISGVDGVNKDIMKEYHSKDGINREVFNKTEKLLIPEMFSLSSPEGIITAGCMTEYYLTSRSHWLTGLPYTTLWRPETLQNYLDPVYKKSYPRWSAIQSSGLGYSSIPSNQKGPDTAWWQFVFTNSTYVKKLVFDEYYDGNYYNSLSNYLPSKKCTYELYLSTDGINFTLDQTKAYDWDVRNNSDVFIHNTGYNGYLLNAEMNIDKPIKGFRIKAIDGVRYASSWPCQYYCQPTNLRVYGY